jgi:hypothetical protein
VTNRSTQRGTSWESAVVAYLQQCGWPHAERRVLHGSQDKGDVLGVPGLVIECKSAARIELAQWVTETQAEVAHAGAEFGVVWAKRKGRTSAAHGYVIMDGDTFARLLKAAGW